VQEPADHPDRLTAGRGLVHASLLDADPAATLRRLHAPLDTRLSLPRTRALYAHAPRTRQVRSHELAGTPHVRALTPSEDRPSPHKRDEALFQGLVSFRDCLLGLRASIAVTTSRRQRRWGKRDPGPVSAFVSTLLVWLRCRVYCGVRKLDPAANAAIPDRRTEFAHPTRSRDARLKGLGCSRRREDAPLFPSGIATSRRLALDCARLAPEFVLYPLMLTSSASSRVPVSACSRTMPIPGA